MTELANKIAKNSTSEIERLSAILDSLGTNVLVADVDRTLLYMNPRSRETLRGMARQLKEELGLTVDDMVGGSIDRFHKDPKRIARMLADPNNLPHIADIDLGDKTLRLEVNSVMSSQGDFIGIVVNWEDVSDRRELEQAQSRIQNMVEVANINMMMSDKDLNLIYMNKASTDTFHTIQKVLPVRVEKMVGSNIDIFHKDPMRVRNILKNPANLPHMADIQMGDEWLALNVSAIMDKQGNYVGPMATWKKITQERALKERDLDVRNQMSEISNEVGDASKNLVNISNVMA
ncbi:MAG: PAS domain-containing protein, partial [Deltaproteobacteria bacterium]|nr:PAS domain-containing protein [Deltaproteobacteria bacterium]